MNGPIVCEVCGRVLEDPANLIVHYEIAHPAPAVRSTQPSLFDSDRVHRVRVS